MSKKTINDEEILDACQDEIEETSEVEEETSISLEDQIVSLNQQIEILKNDYLKVFAETENVKKRLIREADATRKYRAQSFVMTILPVIDNLERALKHETSDEKFREGIQMIHEQLMGALHAEGVEPIVAVGQTFDPNIHQAMMTEACEGVESNTVMEEFQKGYMLKDRILRASLVKVSE